MAGPTVPAGRYSAEVLAKLGEARVFGEGYAARVQANVVSQETSVRVVLSKVALGEADAGFVYATEAAPAAGRVKTLEIPGRYNVTAQYPIAILVRSPAAGPAKAFVEMVTGAEGQALLRKHGFAR